MILVSGDSKKGLTGKWSKWGGAREVVIKEEVSIIWFCQSCGYEQPKDISPYLIKIVRFDDYIRVCHVCFHDASSVANHLEHELV